MTISSTTRIRQAGIVVTALAIAACSGGSGPTESTPSTGENDGTGGPVAYRIMDGYLEAPDPFTDTDSDGIPDAADEFPGSPVQRADAYGSDALAIESVFTGTVDGILDDAGVPGATLTVTGRGFDSAPGKPLLVFAAELGPVAVIPTRISADTWTAVPPRGAAGVYAVIGNRRSNAKSLHWLRPGAPRLVRVDQPLATGSTVALAGNNLDAATRAMLGSQDLEIVSADPGQLRLRLPSAPASNRLAIAGSNGRVVQVIDLPLEHTIGMQLDTGLPAGLAATGRYRGKVFALGAGDTVDLAVTGHAPAPVYLKTDQSHSALGAIAWPDRAAVSVSSASTLLTDLWVQRVSLPLLKGMVWRDQRALLETALELPEARDYIAGHRAWLAGDSGWDRYAARQRVFDALRATTGEAATATTKTAPAARKLTVDSVQDLDDIVAFTMSSYTRDKPEFEDNSTIDQPLVDIPGTNYSQFEIATHEETRLGFDICSYPPNTPVPAGIWPSDLCLQNGTATFASAAVYQPDRKTFGVPYSPSPADLVRRHITGPESTEAANDGAIYLTDNRSGAQNQPTLCRMQTCFVEVLTSGFGNGYKDIGLTPEERRVVRDLRMKWVFEGMIVPILADKLGFAQVPACLPGEIYADARFYTKVDEFVAATRSNRADLTLAKARDLFDSSVAALLKGILTGALSDDANIVECVATEVVKSEIRDRLINATQFGRILDAALFAGGLLFTPEEFTFRVQYRAEVSDVISDAVTGEARTLVDTVNGLYIDEAQTNPRELQIDGTWIANQQTQDNTSQTYFPNVVFRDNQGNTESFLTDVSHYVDTGDPYLRQLQIPLLSLVDNAGTDLNNLVPGPVDITLEFVHEAIDGYDGRLLRVPSPVGIRLKTRPRVLGFTPPSGAPGAFVTANGYDLDSLGSGPSLALYRHLQSGDFSCSTADQSTRLDIPPADVLTLPGGREIQFMIPDNAATEAFYYLCVTPVAGTAAQTTASEIPLFTLDLTRTNTGLVTFSDFGRLKDDRIRLSVLDNFGQPIAYTDTFCPSDDPTCERNVELVFEIPNPEDGRYVRTLFWDNDILNNNYGTNARSLLVECLDPGNDSTCTYGIGATNVTLEDIDTATGPVSSDAGKIPTGYKLEYNIIYP